jgi:hypothetical protein
MPAYGFFLAFGLLAFVAQPSVGISTNIILGAPRVMVSWNDANAWSLLRIPAAGDIVIIQNATVILEVRSTGHSFASLFFVK